MDGGDKGYGGGISLQLWGLREEHSKELPSKIDSCEYWSAATDKSPKNADESTSRSSCYLIMSVVNRIGDTSPPLDFHFVTETVLDDRVEQVPDDFTVDRRCRKDNDRNRARTMERHLGGE